jgi:phage baseplate assembly protein W
MSENKETPQPETPQPSPPTLEEQARERVRQALLRYKPRSKPKRWR